MSDYELGGILEPGEAEATNDTAVAEPVTVLRSVTLLAHRAGATWWAESPEVPGFSVAAGDITELLLAAHDALAEDLTETERLNVRISYDTEFDSPRTDEPGPEGPGRLTGRLRSGVDSPSYSLGEEGADP